MHGADLNLKIDSLTVRYTRQVISVCLVLSWGFETNFIDRRTKFLIKFSFFHESCEVLYIVAEQRLQQQLLEAQQFQYQPSSAAMSFQ